MSRGRNGAANDLVLLDDISEQGILRNLAAHHSVDEIYTYIGQVLISVNPYKDIGGLYGSGKIKKFVGKKDYQNAPHVYAVAERAYRNMILSLSNECIVITGESGSGKTEASKKVMEYIAAMASKSKQVQRVKGQLLESNPLLEAFGNAKTVRNDNSSRFGKYMEILFLMGDPAGGRIAVYLLEKSRVIQQQQDERNFHIFYQLMSNGGRRYGLSGNPMDYRYLAQGNCTQVRGINDSHDFDHTKRAMSAVGISDQEQDAIFSILGAILHLGNVEPSGSRERSQVGGQAVQQAAKMLGVPEGALAKALTNRTVKSGIESVMTPLDKSQSAFARDSLAKSLYGKLFDWIVERVNTTIHTDSYGTSIGVLDIYGFEILGVNGFEQLCINFTNEKLHQLFIELTLKAEQDEYRVEGIQWQPVQFYNNLPICNLIENRGGMFSLLDEESIFPQGSDASLYRKMTSNLRQREFQTPPRSASQFLIKHYAGLVTYETVGMLEKNKDTLFPNLVLLMLKSGNPVAKSLFRNHPHAAKSKTNKRPPTTCMQFKKQVNDLMLTLKGCNQHYIRCIKPNDSKRAGIFQNELVLLQVQYLGLLENVKVRRAGFAFRMPFTRFVAKYKCIAKGHNEWEPDVIRATKSILKGANASDFQLGKSKIFIKSPQTVFQIEDMRKAYLDQASLMLPADDGIVYADKVFGLNEKYNRVPLNLVVGGQGFYFFNKDGSPAQYFPMEKVELISYNEREGWIILHSTYPGKKEQDPMVNLSFLVENVYADEAKNMVEVLHSMGNTQINISESSSIPMDSRDPQLYKQTVKMIGKREGPRGGANIGGGGCCTIS